MKFLFTLLFFGLSANDVPFSTHVIAFYYECDNQVLSQRYSLTLSLHEAFKGLSLATIQSYEQTLPDDSTYSLTYLFSDMHANVRVFPDTQFFYIEFTYWGLPSSLKKFDETMRNILKTDKEEFCSTPVLGGF